MEEIIKETRRVLKLFENVRKRGWKGEVMLVDLVEEVGELANAILVKEGFKSKKRKKADLEDSLADVLFDIFMIADYYRIDIEKVYRKTLKELEKRVKRKEFDDEDV